MAKFVTARFLTLPALLLGSISLSACSGHGYGHGSQFAGANCDVVLAQHCAGYGAYGGHSAVKTRYGTSAYASGYQQQVYAQPQMMLRPAPVAQPQMAQSTTYQQPRSQAPSYSAVSTPSYDVELFNSTVSAPANCPAGTTAQSDGTCLQGSSISSYTSPLTAPSYSAPTTTSSYTNGYITSGSPLNCPAGTTASSDGTCLQGGSSSYSSSTYTGPSYSSSSSSIAPPVSSHDFSDYDWGSKDTTWGSDNYVSPGSRIVDAPISYPAAPSAPSGYMPSRK